MRIEDSEFRNVTQHLDGNEFIRCKFIDSELVFSAESPVGVLIDSAKKTTLRI